VQHAEIRAVVLRRAGQPDAAAVRRSAASDVAPWPVVAAPAVDETQARPVVPSPAARRDAPWLAARRDAPWLAAPPAPLAVQPALAVQLFRVAGRTRQRSPPSPRHQPKTP